jgi:biopolymer transport protein ExbB
MTLSLISTAAAQTLSTATATISAAAGTVSAVAAQAASKAANPYGLGAIWSQGDWVAKGCLLLLAIMSIASWYVMVSKFIELRKLKAQSVDAHGSFNPIAQFTSKVTKLAIDNPMRYIAESGQEAVRQFGTLKPRIDYDTWLIRAIEQSLSKVQTRMQSGMSVLATIGSTAPFVGLFGTVWAIYTALVKIGASGQASIDRVAGPVGEALIMTAIGLAVAVPAVFGYNWLLRKNKLALESVRGFGAKLHMVLLSSTLTLDAKPSDEPKA